MSKPKKKFDAVEMKRKIQAELYEETKDLSPTEWVEYYRKAGEKGPFGKLFKAAHGKTKKKPASSE